LKAEITIGVAIVKVVYLTWGETPRSYGVFGSQVIGQYRQTAKILPDSEFHFVSAVPIIHSGLLREGWDYISELRAIKANLAPIQFHWIPIWASQNFVNSSRMSFRLVHGPAHVKLFNLLRSIQADIVHCRSYHAAWAALAVRTKYGLDYKIIFDGRGLWPEEVSLKKGWLQNSKNYSFLKSIELQLLKQCDYSVSVSENMHEHYRSLGASNDHTVYLSTDVNQLKVNLDQRCADDKVRFCYVGALSDHTWHRPRALVDLYHALKLLYPESHLTIVTSSSHEDLKTEFSEFRDKEISFIQTFSRSHLKDVLSRQDFGLMAYFLPDTEEELLLANVVLAVKTAEYLIAGLPMICNKFCGGAAGLINNNNLGVTYNPKNFLGLQKEKIDSYLNDIARRRCQEYAAENFSYETNAQKYADMYLRLSN
jgi:glycosyltransferase involved in cell wall biosynthesis